MISWQVEMRRERYVLVERDYPAQGISPFYTVMCRLEPEEARALVTSRLVSASGCEVQGLPRTGVRDILFLEQPTDGVLELWLRLPEKDGRPAVELIHPGYGSMLAEAAKDGRKRANLVANTGVADLPEAATAALHLPA